MGRSAIACGRARRPMPPIISRLRSTARSSSERARRIAAVQSTATPSASASAASSTMGRRSVMRHHLGKPDECAPDGDTRGIGRDAAARECELFVAVAKFDAADNQASIVGTEGCESASISRRGLFADCGIQRRRRACGVHGVALRLIARSSHPSSHLIGDAILYGASKVGLQRVVAARLKPVEPAKGLQERVLHEVGGVGRGAGPARQSSVCPSKEWRELSLKERVEGQTVTITGTPEQPQRGPRGRVIAASRTHVRTLSVHRCHRGASTRRGGAHDNTPEPVASSSACQ